MSGYRTSRYEPYSGPDYGRPLRPFDTWQWVGVGFEVVGALVVLAAIAGQLGWLAAKAFNWLPVGTSLCVVGTLLINSRRETLSAEETAKRRRQALIGAAIGFAISALIIAIAFTFKGAH